ncbi:MAG: F0F1 ATP synthase subunit A [Candidatus Dojkabacteria bacterium]
MTVETTELNVQPETLEVVMGIPITNAMLTQVLVTIILLVVSLSVYLLTKGIKNPTKLQVVFEMIVLLSWDFIEKITGNRKVAKVILPIIGTLFIYIATANLVTTVFPLLAAFTYDGTSMFRTPTNDINATVSMAVAMVLLSHMFSIKEYNFFAHVNKYIRIGQLVKGFKGGVEGVIFGVVEVFVGILDLISEFAKVVSLSLRLFGNMFAGELLIGVLLGLFALFLPIPVIFLGLLSGFLQAIVFGALSSSYISLAVKH